MAVVVAVALVLASAGAGVGAWLWARHGGSPQPEISAYSHGRLARVGPYFYCNVLDLNDCHAPQIQGELAVNDRDPIQLSVPTAIGEAPWRLMQVYEDPANTTMTVFRPESAAGGHDPTVDPQRGRLKGFAVQLLTLGVDRTVRCARSRTPNGRCGRCGTSSRAVAFAGTPGRSDDRSTGSR